MPSEYVPNLLSVDDDVYRIMKTQLVGTYRICDSTFFFKYKTLSSAELQSRRE